MNTAYRHSAYPEDNIQPELTTWWLHQRENVLRDLLKRPKRSLFFGSGKSDNLLLYPPELYIKEHILNGRKPQNKPSTDSRKSSQPPPLEWLDGQLAPEDISVLESDEISLEHLASELVGLVGGGYGVSVKYDFERERYNCTIYRPPFGKQRRNLGLSGNSPDLRDAILVTMYRFNVKFGGVIDDSSADDTHAKQKRRFG